MVIEILSYLIPIFQLGLPLYLVYRIWTTDFNLQAHWGITALHAALTLVALFIIFRWDVVTYHLRYWGYGVCLLAISVSFLQVSDKPFYNHNRFRWRWGQSLEIGLFLAVIGWSVVGFYPNATPVNLETPLKGNKNVVIHGGDTPILNYHGAAAESQTYALDIGKLNGWGMRAAGLFPGDPRQYAIFGDPVYSPAAGKVVQVGR